MINDAKRRGRAKAKPDQKLLQMLKSGNQSALQMALTSRTLEALAALEETIALYGGNPDVTFYRLGGQRVHTQDSVYSSKEQIMNMALSDSLLADPAYTQSLIAGLGTNPGVSNLIMSQLAVRPQSLYDYQLLGVQMQLAYLLGNAVDTEPVGENIEANDADKADDTTADRKEADMMNAEDMTADNNEADIAAIEMLIKDLGSESVIDTLDAGNKLGEMGKAAVPLLIEAMQDIDRRVGVGTALEKIGKPAIAPLIGCLGDAEWRVRFIAAHALGGIHAIEAVEPLIELLNDPQPDVRKYAAEALGRIGDERADEPLRQRLKQEDSMLAISGINEALSNLMEKRTAANNKPDDSKRKLSDERAQSTNEKSTQGANRQIEKDTSKANVQNANNASAFKTKIRIPKKKRVILFAAIAVVVAAVTAILIIFVGGGASKYKDDVVKTWRDINGYATLSFNKETCVVTIADQADFNTYLMDYKVTGEHVQLIGPNSKEVVNLELNISTKSDEVIMLTFSPEYNKMTFTRSQTGDMKTLGDGYIEAEKDAEMITTNDMANGIQNTMNKWLHNVNEYNDVVDKIYAFARAFEEGDAIEWEEAEELIADNKKIQQAIAEEIEMAKELAAKEEEEPAEEPIEEQQDAENDEQGGWGTAQSNETEQEQIPAVDDAASQPMPQNLQASDIVGVWRIGDFVDGEFVLSGEMIEFTPTEMVFLNTGEREPYTLHDSEMVLYSLDYKAAYALDMDALMLIPPSTDGPLMIMQRLSEEGEAANAVSQTGDSAVLVGEEWINQGASGASGAEAQIPLYGCGTLRLNADGSFEAGQYDGTYRLVGDLLTLDYEMWGRYVFKVNLEKETGKDAYNLSLMTEDRTAMFHFRAN